LAETFTGVNQEMILVTGGAGFIGLNFILGLLQHTDETEIVNVDMLTYAANRAFLPGSKRHVFIQGNVGDRNLMGFVLKNRPHTIVHFAAETHVDQSIHNPGKFMLNNTNGTYSFLETVRATSPDSLFIHVSTDEVYGSLNEFDPPFTESHPYRPNSPYSATKAASDHLVRSWHETYGLKTIITNCSNNFGLFQHAEKLIPMAITRALRGESIPVYGNGKQIRDWIHVDDHCAAIRFLMKNGQPGQQYNIGANNERTNISVVHKICQTLDRVKPRENNKSYNELIEFVQDRPGHDRRYALDTAKINSLGWNPNRNFDLELEKLIKLYTKE
jgi:dTDP-glucose 4,6-dehydratase